MAEAEAKANTQSGLVLGADIEDLHRQACKRGEETYVDPHTGFQVFTALAHKRRGGCCGFRCRHCPFKYRGVRGEGHSDAGTGHCSAEKDANLGTDTVEGEGRGRAAKEREKRHGEACSKGLDHYVDPISEDRILTKVAHLRRGRCCGSGCRHCPYREEAKTHATPVAEKGNSALSGPSRRRRRTGKRKGIIYTRSGDKGTSSLFTGERQGKDSAIFEALGTVDELNSTIGCAYSAIAKTPALKELQTQLETLMCWLLDVGSHIATPRCPGGISTKDSTNDTLATKAPTTEQLERTKFDSAKIDEVEEWMDEKISILPDLTSFVLPCGGQATSCLHVCRTVCRRAERRLLPLVKAGTAEPESLQFVNRLSDYFFVMARYATFVQRGDEITYASTSELRRTANRRGLNDEKESLKDSDETSRSDICNYTRASELATQLWDLKHVFVILLAFLFGVWVGRIK